MARKTVDITDHNFGVVLTCAVRYALGRRTYVPSLLVDYITPLLPMLHERDLTNLERSIIWHGEQGFSYGDNCDKITWSNFLDAIQKELTKRNEQ